MPGDCVGWSELFPRTKFVVFMMMMMMMMIWNMPRAPMSIAFVIVERQERASNQGKLAS